jgi:hypothetical protein
MRNVNTVTQACVIYRAHDGAIVHVHFEGFAPGMTLHAESRMEELARERATAKRRDLTNVKFLHLKDSQFHGWATHVDPATGKLVVVDQLPGKTN